jgi:hypothetical protein
MKIDPGMHIGLQLVFFGKTGVTHCGFSHRKFHKLRWASTLNQKHLFDNPI